MRLFVFPQWSMTFLFVKCSRQNTPIACVVTYCTGLLPYAAGRLIKNWIDTLNFSTNPTRSAMNYASAGDSTIKLWKQLWQQIAKELYNKLHSPSLLSAFSFGSIVLSSIHSNRAYDATLNTQISNPDLSKNITVIHYKSQPYLRLPSPSSHQCVSSQSKALCFSGQTQGLIFDNTLRERGKPIFNACA